MHTIASRVTGEIEALRRVHPLRRWDPAYFPEHFGRDASGLGTMALPEARAEAQTLALRASREKEGAGDRTSRLTVADIADRADAGDAAWLALARHLRLAPLPARPPPAEGRVVVPIHALVKFLEMPLQGWARFRLGLDELEDEDVFALETEPFETNPREETLLLRDVLHGAAQDGVAIEQAYDARVRDRALRGQGPSGLFARGERADHLRALRMWQKVLADDQTPHDSLVRHRFGRAGEQAQADAVHPALAIDVDYVDPAGVTRLVRAQLAGRLLAVGCEGTVSVTLNKRANAAEDDWAQADGKRITLRAFVDHAILSAAGVRPGDRHASLHVLATPGKPVRQRRDLAPLAQDQAVAWLRDRIRELLSEPHAYFLPCEAIFKWAGADGPRGALVPVVEEAREKSRGGDGPPALRSAYGPVPRPHEYPIPAEAEARAIVARRFALLLDGGGEATP